MDTWEVLARPHYGASLLLPMRVAHADGAALTTAFAVDTLLMATPQTKRKALLLPNALIAIGRAISPGWNHIFGGGACANFAVRTLFAPRQGFDICISS